MRRRGLRTVLASALLGAIACGGGTAATSDSGAPRITAGSGGPLAAGLLGAPELLAAGLPQDARIGGLGDTTVFADPDPRGPCGAKVPALDVSGAAGEAIQSASFQGVELLVRADEAVAKAYLDPRAADATGGCPEFQTVTNTGATQRVHLDRVVPLTVSADQALATQQAILVGDKVTSATVVHVRRGGVIARVTLFAATPPTTAVVQSLAAAVATDLAKVG